MGSRRWTGASRPDAGASHGRGGKGSTAAAREQGAAEDWPGWGASPWIELPRTIAVTTSTSDPTAVAATATTAVVVGVEARVNGELTAVDPVARRGA
jgi:hypothetical protein